MNRNEAESLWSEISSYLKEKETQSYPKIVHIKSNDSYVVKIVLHPDESHLEKVYPNVSTSPWDEQRGSPYVKRTPRTPSQNTDDFGFYPSSARRHHDGPSRSPDINPAYPGLRRIPELQDLVRRVAMNPELHNRLAKVQHTLEKLARAGNGGFEKESEHLVSELLDQLKKDGYTGRHKITRLTKSLQSAMKSDGYKF